jgi:O-antigen ligase
MQHRKLDSSPGAGKEQSRRSQPRPSVVLCLMLWVMLWGGYNTDIGVVLAPNFPANPLQLIHGIRAFLPLFAGWLAVLVILSRGGPKGRAIGGPLGLLAFFVAIGLISSAFLSRYSLDGLYWVGMYGSVLAVLIAVCSNSDALSALSRVIMLNWIIDIALLVGLLAAIPFLGETALAPTSGSPLDVMAYNRVVAAHGTLLGMSATRNTGFGRYAAVAGLVALGRLWQGKKLNKLIWIGVLFVALYVLVRSQARTETLGFLAGALVILVLRRHRRAVLFGVGALGVLLLGLMGFFQDLWSFETHGRGFDPTLTGRTATWQQGLEVVRHSPWLGLGFQADRYYLNGQHMHDTVLHALIQTGALGTIAYVAAYGLAWFLLVRLYLSRSSKDLPDELPGVLVFFTIMSITESIAYYSANWLLLAPVLAYIQVLAWQQRALKRNSGYSRLAAPSSPESKTADTPA